MAFKWSEDFPCVTALLQVISVGVLFLRRGFRWPKEWNRKDIVTKSGRITIG